MTKTLFRRADSHANYKCLLLITIAHFTKSLEQYRLLKPPTLLFHGQADDINFASTRHATRSRKICHETQLEANASSFATKSKSPHRAHFLSPSNNHLRSRMIIWIWRDSAEMLHRLASLICPRALWGVTKGNTATQEGS